MKRITLLIILCFIGIQASAQTSTDYFITTWKTDNISTGSSNDTSINIPTSPSETYSYDVDWDNDGNLATCTKTTTYTAGGWDNDEPDSNTAAIIAANYNTSLGNIDACSLTVYADAILTVGAGGYVEVQEDITNNGTIIVESTYDELTNSLTMGSIVQVLDTGTATNSGTINVQYKTPLMAPKTFVGVGSPMTGETRDGVFATSYLFLNHHTENFLPNAEVGGIFGEAINFADDNGDNWLPYNDGLNPGEG